MRGAPRRPPVPLLAWFAAGMWIGCVAGEHIAWAAWAGTTPDGLPWCLAGAGVALVAAWLRTEWRGAAVLLLAGIVAGVVASGAEAVGWRAARAEVSRCGARGWEGAVEADAASSAFGTVVRVRLGPGPMRGAAVRVLWPSGVEVPDAGRVVRMRAVLEPLPDDEVWARRAARSGLVASGRPWTASVGGWRPGVLGRLLAWRASVLHLMRGLPGPGGALLEGVVLGDRRRLAGTIVEDDFRTLGLTHLVAVSGSHLALACGAVALVGRLARISRRRIVVVTVLAGTTYALVTGMPYSALRSLLMLVAGGAAELLGRRSAPAGSLAVAVTAVLAWDPWAAFDVGFQLSAAAVAGLVLFGRLAADWVLSAFGGRWRPVAEAVGLTCVAQLATLPVSVSTFGMVSVLAPLANAIAGPLVAASLCTGLLSSLVVSAMPQAGALGLRASAAVLGLTAAIAGALARFPGAAIPASMAAPGVVLLLAAMGLVWIRWPTPPSSRVARRALAVACAVSLALTAGSAPARDASVCVLDVGQGDAVLVRDSGRAMLVDTGPDPVTLRRALARHGLRRIDVIVLTHAHDDHTGGVGGLAGVVEVGWVAVSASGGGSAFVSDALVRRLDVRTVAQGDRWRIGDTEVVVAWPRRDINPGTPANDTSVVLYLRRGAFDAVLTGDAEVLAQQGMAADGFMAPVEVLKVPHHGSSNGLTEAALASWRPDVAVISVGSDNEFGHPSPGTLSLLRRHGVVTWRTDQSGEVTIRIGRRGYAVSGRGRASRGPRHSRLGRLGERMDAPDERYGIPVAHRVKMSSGGMNGRTTDRGPQTDIPHLWEGAAPSRARAPPPEGPCRSGRRPRLQLRHIRR